MKYCFKCARDLPEENFGKNASKSDGLQSQCKECRRETNNNHYRTSANRREAIRRNAKKAVQKARALISKYKDAGCSVCGETEHCALDFHHLDPSDKEYIISEMITFSETRLQKEIDKCIVLCANCHRKVHGNIITLE